MLVYALAVSMAAGVSEKNQRDDEWAKSWPVLCLANYGHQILPTLVNFLRPCAPIRSRYRLTSEMVLKLRARQ